MKQLKDYSEDIYKCTKCGLCQSVCPIFDETGLEATVSRGKFSLLHGVLSGKLDFSRKIADYLEYCLGCQACSDFCPSGISAEDIVIAARQEGYKKYGTGFLKALLLKNFDSKQILSVIKLLLDIYRLTGLQNINKIPFLPKIFSENIILFNHFVREKVKYKKLNPAKQLSDLKILYFPGCINTYINPSVKNAVLMVLEKNGISAKIPENLSCCGIPARSAGNLELFIKQAKENLDRIDVDIDYLVTDCASCGSVWKHYAEVLDGEYKEKAERLAGKAININKLLAGLDIYIPENVKIEKTVTYHDPCHLSRFQRIKLEPREILKKIPGINFIEMQEADRCCGASGSFCLTKSEISRSISAKKAKNIIQSEAQIVSTSCPSCEIGILQGLVQVGNILPVYQPVELLAELYLKEEN